MQKPATFKSTLIIYYALFLGQALMAAILLYSNQENGVESVASPFNMIIPSAVLIGFAGAYFLRQFQMNSLPENSSLQEKLNHFQRWSILQFAVAEGGNLICIVLTFLHGNTSTYIWFAVGLGLFVLLRPNRERFIEEYAISENFD